LTRHVGFTVSITMLILLLCFSSAPAATQSARTFYIDYTSGSNSNSGTQASPWKTHPYMQTSAACTGSGSAPSYSHQAGDQFIFKGGVTWPASCFGMIVQQGGSSSAQDYYGTCGGQSTAPVACNGATWPTSGWTRPLWDLNYGTSTTDHVVEAGDADNSKSGGLKSYYITFDNIEIAHLGVYWSNPGGNCLQAVFLDFTACGGQQPSTGSKIVAG
jgi:hypothetical protein